MCLFLTYTLHHISIGSIEVPSGIPVDTNKTCVTYVYINVSIPHLHAAPHESGSMEVPSGIPVENQTRCKLCINVSIPNLYMTTHINAGSIEVPSGIPVEYKYKICHIRIYKCVYSSRTRYMT